MPTSPTPKAQAELAACPEGAAETYWITKGGAYYRPKAQGYTRSKLEAGRFTLEEAIAYSHPNGPDGPRDGIRYEPATLNVDSDTAALVERLRALADENFEMLNDIHEPLIEAADALERLASRSADGGDEEQVERVAKALCDVATANARRDLGDDAILPTYGWEDWLPDARAAIAAMPLRSAVQVEGE